MLPQITFRINVITSPTPPTLDIRSYFDFCIHNTKPVLLGATSIFMLPQITSINIQSYFDFRIYNTKAAL